MEAPLLLLAPEGGLADANPAARALFGLPPPPAPLPALEPPALADRLGATEAAFGGALLRARGQSAPTPLGLRPARAGNLDVLRAAVETLRDGATVRGHLLSIEPRVDGLRGFARLTDELDARTRELAAERVAARALQAERDRARVVAEVIAEDIGAPAGRIAARLGTLLRAQGLIGSEAARQALEAVSEEVWKLLDTVATVLEHGAREPVALAGEPVDLAACCGEALSRLRAENASGPAPVCELDPALRVRGDWRLTPLLLQRCFAYAATRGPVGAPLAARALPARPGRPLVIAFGESGAPARDSRGAALLLALSDLAEAHGWQAAPAFGAGPALTLTIPPDHASKTEAAPHRRGVAPRDRRR